MSPIKGISDRPRLPRLGKIRLGIKVEEEGKKPYPRAVDYFVCPGPVGEVFGEQPKELRIAFPTNDVDQWASAWYRCYSSYRGLVCRGDGDEADRWVDLDKAVVKETGELPQSLEPQDWPVASRDTKRWARQRIHCPPVTCPEFQMKPARCKPVMNLQFLLPEVPGIGIWQLDTSSWNSIRNVLDGVNLVKGLTGGRVSLIPLTLSLIPLQVQPEGVKKTVHVLRLSAPYKLADLFRQAQLPAGAAFALPEPDLEPPDDLFPEEEPTEPPVEATVDSFFQDEADEPAAQKPTEAEERAATWAAIKDVLAKGLVKPHQLVAWLRKEANVAISLPDVGKEAPPNEVPTPVMRRLHDALAQYQLKLEQA